MQLLLSCAKTMTASSRADIPFQTEPAFTTQASDIALQMTRLDVSELSRVLRVNDKLAVENFHRYQQFHDPDATLHPAVLAYSGIVFKRLHASDFTLEDFEYAQEHLNITSFCYGLLRPLDAIRMYRLEGEVLLPDSDGVSVFDFWKPYLTDYLIEKIRQSGGILFNFASDEMRNLFDWKKLVTQCRVITPEFKVYKNGKPKTVVIYTKMCRGELTRYVLKHRIEQPEDLSDFTWEGFGYDEQLSKKDHLVFSLV